MENSNRKVDTVYIYRASYIYVSYISSAILLDPQRELIIY